MEGGGPRMKAKDGVFGCSYCYISLNRQNSKFQLQGLIYYFEKGVIEKHRLRRDGAFQHFQNGLEKHLTS